MQTITEPTIGNCMSMTMRQLHASKAYKNLPRGMGKNKLKKEELCAVLFPELVLSPRSQLNPTNFEDCQKMTIEQLKSTDVYKSLPGRSKLKTKPQICNAIQQYISFPPSIQSTRRLLPITPPRISQPKQPMILSPQNCNSFTRAQLRATPEYKRLQNKSLLTTKEKICNAIFQPQALQLGPTGQLTRENCESMTLAQLRATDAYKNLPNNIGKSKLKKVDLCNVFFSVYSE